MGVAFHRRACTVGAVAILEDIPCAVRGERNRQDGRMPRMDCALVRVNAPSGRETGCDTPVGGATVGV